MRRLTRSAVLAPVVLLAVWFVLLRPASLGGGTEYIFVSGTSMEPTLHTGDLSVLRRQSEYAAGDIVAFRVDGGLVIHRVIGGSAAEGYAVQGDNKAQPDLWKPTPEEILGRQWLHVPDAGTWLAKLRGPRTFGFVAASLVLFGEVTRSDQHRRRRQKGRHMHSRDTKGTRGGAPPAFGLGSSWPGGPRLLGGLAVALVVAVACAIVAVVAFRGTAERTEYVERLGYEQSSTFGYTAQMQRSTLYPDGVVEPLTLPGAEAQSPQPIYTQLARSLTVRFEYTLSSRLPADLDGTLAANLTVRAGEGWTRTLELLAPTPFDGATASGSFDIDVASLQSLIAGIEEETGFTPRVYTLSVEPTVEVSGTVGGEPINETYAPVLEIQYDETVIAPASTLVEARPTSIGEDVVRVNELDVLGLALPVRTWRWAGAAGAGLALSVAGALAAVAYLGLGRDEDERIQARYRGMLMPVQANGSSASASAIHVASVADLARLAQRDGGIIFHEPGPHTHRYFIRDGEDTYDYTVHLDHRIGEGELAEPRGSAGR